MLALRHAPSYDALKAACQDEITFLDEHGGLNNGVAHLVEPTPRSTFPDHEQEEQEEEEEAATDDTAVLACFTGEQLVQIAALPSESRDLVLAMGRNFRPRPKAKAKAKGQGKAQGQGLLHERPPPLAQKGPRSVRIATATIVREIAPRHRSRSRRASSAASQATVRTTARRRKPWPLQMGTFETLFPWHGGG